MNARGLLGLSRRNFLAWSAALGVAGVVGCKHSGTPTAQTRSQIGEDPSDPDAVVTVGSKTAVTGVEPIAVSGVSFVYQLPGTGSSPPSGGWRARLEESLKKLKRDQTLNTKELLDGPGRTTSLVLVSALIPPGARKGELIDVQITLPEESKTVSLQGGVLYPCELFESNTTGNIHSQVTTGAASGPNGRLLLGSKWADTLDYKPLVAGNFAVQNGKPAPQSTDSDGRPVYRAGMIADGAKVATNRPYYLQLNENEKRSTIAATIAERLNSTFHSTADSKVAEAKSNEFVLLNVPTAYRNNHYRFLLVARQVPYSQVRSDSLYRQKLVEDLMEPATALTAAIKLEALGGDVWQSLRVGLESPSPWVQFAAAEALAYLGRTDGVEALARLAEDHPALRAQCLKALASVNDESGNLELVKMLTNPDAELRQGAFIALRLADPKHATVAGTLMNRSYVLHKVAPDAPAAVHLTSTGRTEVAIYGDVKFRGALAPVAVGAEYTVSVPAGQPAKITRVFKGREDAEVKEVRCRSDLHSVLTVMANLGGGYSEAIELIRKLDRAEVLTGKIVLDAIPRELSIQQLSGFAKVDPTLAKVNQEVARVGTVRPAVDAHGFELPSTQEATVPPAGAPLQKPPLNRDPGRLFGPKRAADTPILDPNVVSTGGQ